MVYVSVVCERVCCILGKFLLVVIVYVSLLVGDWLVVNIGGRVLSGYIVWRDEQG